MIKIIYILVLILLILIFLQIFDSTNILLNYIFITAISLLFTIGIQFLCFSDMQFHQSDYNITGGSSSDMYTYNKQIIPISGHVFDKFVCDQLSPTVKTLLEGKPIKISHLDDNPIKAQRLSRKLYPTAPRKKYTPRPLEFKRVLHWGQLKLMLSEIEFLTIVTTEYAKLNKRSTSNRPIHMVYAGAAPGCHIPYLHKLFPHIYFHLYDINKFNLQPTDHIKIYNQLFLDTDAKKWAKLTKKYYIVLCSDIRTEPATEKNVKENMNMQLNWWKIIQPELSIFKFRLPWQAGYTEYPDGDIYFQAFPGPTSTETRLVVKKNAKLVKYDHSKYEEQCYYHNTVNRCKWYPTILGELTLKKDSVDNCYDCASFIKIIENYLKARDMNRPNQNSSNAQYKNEIRQLLDEIQYHSNKSSQNIYTQTIKSFNEILDYIYIRLHAFCDKSKCQLYCQQRKKDSQWFISHQKQAAYLQQAIQDAQKIKNDKHKSAEITRLKNLAMKDLLNASEKGWCEEEPLELIK